MNINYFLDKIYNDLFYNVIVKQDFIEYYTDYFINHLKLNFLTNNELIEYSIFFWKNQKTICKNLARNKMILKRYWIE